MTRKAFHVELVEHPLFPRRTIAIRCLQCGQRSTGSGWSFASNDLGIFMARHVCDEAKLEGFDWKTVARDAFLEGRDTEAIRLICEEMGLISI